MIAANWILIIATQAERGGERKCCGRIPYNLFKSVLIFVSNEHDRRASGPCNWLRDDDLASSRGKGKASRQAHG